MPSGPTIICVVGTAIWPLTEFRAPRLYDTSIAPTANAPPTAPKAALMVESPCRPIHQGGCQQFSWEIRTYAAVAVLNDAQIVTFSEQWVNGVFNAGAPRRRENA